MPTLVLKLAAAPDAKRDAEIAESLTTLTADILGKRREVTAVIIENTPAPRWYIDAQPVQRPTAWLEISITAGTNTAEQKSRFITAVYAELQRRLAPGDAIEAASYVIVRELPETDWGYGGQTQQSRRLVRERAAVTPA